MSGRTHVLLIGIDAYDGGGMLTGCVNDIDAVQRVLVDRVGVDPQQIRRLVAARSDQPHDTSLPEQVATLANIRGELDRLASEDVDAGDRVFIYYSGHGTQCVVDDGQRRFTREALLPKDKLVGPTRQFLFDWELNAALARIAARTRSVTVVLDACSSGGATRAIPPAGATERFFATTQPVMATPPMGASGIVAAAAAVDQCQVVAACRADQRATEAAGADGTVHGELTRAFVAQLATVETQDLATLSWGRVWRALDVAVRTANPRQSPLLCGRYGRRIFGLGDDEDGDPGIPIVQVGDAFEVSAGTLHGVTKDAVIGVYGGSPPALPPVGSPEDRAALRGRVKIDQADSTRATGTAVEPFALPESARGRLVAAGSNVRLRVRASDAVATASIAASPLLQLVGDAEDVTVVHTDTAWALLDDLYADSAAPFVAVPLDRADLLVAVLEQYSAYIAPVRLARSCSDLPGALVIAILDCSRDAPTGAAAQDPQLPAVQQLPVDHRVCFTVLNTSDVALEVTLFDASSTGAVSSLGAAQIQPRATHALWAGGTLGAPFTLAIPDGMATAFDRLVAIGTTNTSAALDSLVRRTTFADLLARPRMRGGVRGDPPGPAPALDRWTATVTVCRISRS